MWYYLYGFLYQITSVHVHFLLSGFGASRDQTDTTRKTLLRPPMGTVHLGWRHWARWSSFMAVQRRISTGDASVSQSHRAGCSTGVHIPFLREFQFFENADLHWAISYWKTYSLPFRPLCMASAWWPCAVERTSRRSCARCCQRWSLSSQRKVLGRKRTSRRRRMPSPLCARSSSTDRMPFPRRKATRTLSLNTGSPGCRCGKIGKRPVTCTAFCVIWSKWITRPCLETTIVNCRVLSGYWRSASNKTA